MRSMFVLGALLALALAVSACGYGEATQTAAPAAIVLTTNPNPPTSGNVEMIATVNDANGTPLEGAEVFVFGNHTEMAGMTLNGKATGQGGGRYTLNTDFSMGGIWKITVQVKKPPINVTQIFNLAFK
jgi:hypothetical protein